MPLFLGIDLGTSYFKVGLFDEAGALRGLGRIAVDKSSPVPGRFELPVEAFWERLQRGLKQALAQAGASVAELTAISYSSQANTFVLLDRNSAPLTPFIFWNDGRAHPVEDKIARFGQTEAFRRTVGYEGIVAECAPPKWRWFMHHEPAVWARADQLMTISDYITFALTGERAGDASTAAFTGLYDLQGKNWWAEALAMFGLDRRRLSTPLPPGAPCGRTVSQATKLLGLPVGIPFAVGGLDHHVAALGSGLGRYADMSISTGTVLAALALVDNAVPQSGCYHGPHVDGVRYYRLAFDAAGAGQLEDYQRRCAPDATIEHLLALAGTVKPDSRPGSSPPATGTDRDHGVAVRHLLEKISANHRGLVGRVAGGGPIQTVVATGGGARSAIWVQITADMFGVPVVTTKCMEQACLGAALLAAAAVGIFSTAAEASLAMVHSDRIFEPDAKAAAIYRERTGQA